jgi:hypothetical protein
MTRYAFFLWGSFVTKTGFKRQSDEPPGACSVEEPSKDQMGVFSNVPS